MSYRDYMPCGGDCASGVPRPDVPPAQHWNNDNRPASFDPATTYACFWCGHSSYKTEWGPGRVRCPWCLRLAPSAALRAEIEKEHGWAEGQSPRPELLELFPKWPGPGSTLHTYELTPDGMRLAERRSWPNHTEYPRSP